MGAKCTSACAPLLPQSGRRPRRRLYLTLISPVVPCACARVMALVALRRPAYCCATNCIRFEKRTCFSRGIADPWRCDVATGRGHDKKTVGMLFALNWQEAFSPAAAHVGRGGCGWLEHVPVYTIKGCPTARNWRAVIVINFSGSRRGLSFPAAALLIISRIHDDIRLAVCSLGATGRTGLALS
jgi:hypothetical protein